MTSIVFFVGLFIANLSWFIVFWNNYPYFELIVPKFIASSYDPNPKEELDSILLKSLQKYIDVYFQKDNKFSARNLTIDEAEDINLNQLKVTNSSKISMFSKDGQMYILKISNEVDSPNNYDTRSGEVSLFNIPVQNYRKKESFDIQKSIIRKCWSTKFFGRIIGGVASNDKNNLAIFYRLVEGHTINYRIRYYHNLNCTNNEIAKSDNIVSMGYKDYLNTHNDDLNNEYYEIKETKTLYHTNPHNNESSTFSNYFNDYSFDDFSIKGNTPITAMAIKNNIIAYSRNYDYKSFYVLKRVKEDIRSWKVSFMGPIIDRKLYPYYNINSLKFLSDNINDYKLFTVSTAMNGTGIYGKLNIIESNHTEYNNASETKYVMSLNYNKILTHKIIGDSETFNIENSLKELKKIMTQTVYSQTNDNNLLFEFDSGSLYYLSWDEDTIESSSYYINSVKVNDKISKIISCSNNEYILVRFENSKDMKYIHREMGKDNKTNFYLYDITKNISFRSIPKKYREKDGVAYYLELIDDRIILFILNEDGILISLDLSQISKNSKYWYYIFFSDTDLAAWIIIIINISAVLYLNFFRLRNNNLAEITQRRSNEINQVIQDIIRLNNLQQVLNGEIGSQIGNVRENQNEPNNDILIQQEEVINEVQAGENNIPQ